MPVQRSWISTLNDPDRGRGDRGFVCRQPEGDGLAVADAAAARPALVELPPLPPVTRSSRMVAPVAIALSAIRDAAERGTPRTLRGKADNPAIRSCCKTPISAGPPRAAPITATGAQDTLSLTTPLTGTLNVTGSLSSKATGAVGDAIGGLLGGDAAKQIGSINIKNLNVSAEIRGNVVVTSRPRLAAAWRIEPNLAAQVNLGDTSLNVAGARINVPAQVKPLIDKTVAEQIAIGAGADEERSGVRAERARAMGQSLPLDPAAGHRSHRVVAAAVARTETDPRDRRPAAVDASAMILTIGIEAETRVTPTETKPNCPFPATITIGRRRRAASHRRADRPALHRAQQARGGAVRRQDVSRGRLRHGRRHRQARECCGFRRPAADLAAGLRQGKEELFGFGAEANVHIWGVPALDQAQQTLRLNNIELAVEVRGRLRAAGHGDARGGAASAAGAGAEGQRST